MNVVSDGESSGKLCVSSVDQEKLQIKLGSIDLSQILQIVNHTLMLACSACLLTVNSKHSRLSRCLH